MSDYNLKKNEVLLFHDFPFCIKRNQTAIDIGKLIKKHTPGFYIQVLLNLYCQVN